jgi:hypothetical protein
MAGEIKIKLLIGCDRVARGWSETVNWKINKKEFI